MIAQLDRDYVGRRPWKALGRLLAYACFEGRPVTAKGRWINPLVLRFLGMAARLPVPGPAGAPVYIVGTGRSGTTILGTILSLHPAVGYLNEPKAVWHRAYPGEDVIGTFARGDARFRLRADDAGEEAARSVTRIYGLFSSLVGATTVVDKYPEMIFRVPFVKAIFPDARFVLLVRDGWDTLRSIARWSDRLGKHRAGERHDWWGVDDRKWRLLVREIVAEDPRLGGVAHELEGMERHADRAAVEWTVTMREGRRRMREHGASFHLLRYEDLVREPLASLESLLRFCDLETDDEMLRYAEATLRPMPHKPPVQLHPTVEPAFLEMMQAMGYGR